MSFVATAAGSAAPLLGLLARASWQGALFIAAVWIVCRLAPRLPATLRCALWWTASLKLLLALAWPLPLAIPVLPAAAAARMAAIAATSLTPIKVEAAPSPLAPSQLTTTAPGPPPPQGAAGGSASAPQLPVPQGSAAMQGGLAAPHRLAAGNSVAGPAGASPDSVRRLVATGLLAAWLGGFLLQLGWLARELRRSRALVRGSTPLADRRALALLGTLRPAVDQRRTARVLCSPAVRSPQTVGWLRPLVLLPRELGAFDDAELAMALCHELLHVRRRDLWWGWVPLLAERIFFFHPLAAFAAREYALAREAACDAEVVRLLASAPRAYGRLLVKLTVAPAAAGAAVGLHAFPPAGALGAAPAAHNLKRRLQMLDHSSRTAPGSRRLPLLAALLVLAGLVPFEIVAQRSATAPATSSLSAPRPGPVSGPAPQTVLPGDPAATASALATPHPILVPREEPAAVPEPAGGWNRLAATALRPLRALRPIARAMDAGREDQEPILFIQGNNSLTTMGGSWKSVDHVKSLQRKSGGGDLLWFRRGGKEYVVRDAATLKRVQEILTPQQELGRQQGELGARQGKLGAEQGELGARQGKLGAEQGQLGVEQARLALDGARRALDNEGHQEAASDARERELESKMQALAEKQTELGRQQEELGRQQEALGEQQEKLGHEQEKASREAQPQLHALIDQALASGLAQEVH